MNAKTIRIIRTSDKRCWVLQELTQGVHRKTGKMSDPFWKDIGYYGKIRHMIEALINMKIEVPEGTLVQQMKEFLVELEKVEKQITEEIERV